MPTPERGDLVYANFNPQAGIRPGIVLSPKSFNEATGFAVVCPITRQQKGYPFEVALPSGLAISNKEKSSRRNRHGMFGSYSYLFVINLPPHVFMKKETPSGLKRPSFEVSFLNSLFIFDTIMSGESRKTTTRARSLCLYLPT